MYVVNTFEMKLSDGRVLRKGDPVPEAANWEPEVLRAHLRSDNIRVVSDPSPVTTSVEIRTKKGRRPRTP